MSKSPFQRLRESLSFRDSSHRTNRGLHARRRLSFESLEGRQLLAVSALPDFGGSSDTGEKPQSKVWEYNDQWYAAMPDNGMWIWKLNGNQWQQHLQISEDGGYTADVKVVGNLAHIFLFDGSSSRLATVEYDNGPDNRYEMWSLRPSLVDVAVSSSAETAVIDVDTTGRMWVAYDTSSAIEVRYADLGTQYTNWSSPIVVASGIKSDDIGSIVAMPNGSMGVMWSNQNTERFGFRLHVDGADPSTWSNPESAASQSALDKGNGMADDHINLAVASNGTLYAAVKTSYDSSGYPRMALLVRRPSGVWDDLYQVDTIGTRPIVMLNEAAGKLIVAYTQSDSGGNIYFKESSMNTISFGSRQTLISGSVNNSSSVKGNFTDEVVAIAGGGGEAKSAMFRFDGPIIVPPPPQNQAPNVNAGTDRTIQLPAGVALDGTVTDDGNPVGGSLTTSWSMFSGPGTVTFANANAIDTTASFSVAGTYVLRLTASDGSLQTSDTVTIIVEAADAPPVNQPPSVSAGPDRSIVLGSAASLDGTVSDDGLPAAPGAVTRTWSKISGPGTVSFADASATDTTATFSAAGTYVLRLTAFDGLLSAFDEMTVTVASNDAPTTISFQDGVFPAINYQGTRDTKITSSSKNTNYGNATSLDFDGSPDVSDLLYWDTTAIPAGSVIESVTIQLNITNTSSQAYELYELLRSWSETAATWNQAAAGSNWATVGALGATDRSSTVLGTITPSANGLRTMTLNVAGLAVVQKWIDNPSANNGFIIQDYANSSGANFSSSEATTASQRPKLTITYRAGGPDGENPPTNQAPVVDAGGDQSIQLPSSASLSGTVSDDGLPSSPGTVTRTWTRISGPGTVTFGNAANASTTASFSAAGTYVLRLTASDGSLSAFDEVTITVQAASPVNQAPSVSAGPDRSIVLGNSASLDGTVSDDGLPAGQVTTTWTKVSGPGTVNFGNGSSVDTTTTFQRRGHVCAAAHSERRHTLGIGRNDCHRGQRRRAMSISFQDGVAGYQGTRDTKLNSNAKNTNYGNAATLDFDGSPDIADLLFWDVGSIPAGSEIESVTIQLNITNTSSAVYELYQVLRPWNELTATWNQAQAGSTWATAGALSAADRGTTVLGTIAPSTNGLWTITLNAAGIAVVQSWTDDPSSNNGFIIQDYANSSGADFSSSEATNASLRPKLTISYRAGGGSAAAMLSADVNLPPVVDAGANQRIRLPNSATLTPTLIETAGPRATPLLLWTRVSGPDTVTFGDASAANTTASFSTAGTYTLRLTVNDGEFEVFDELSVIVDLVV